MVCPAMPCFPGLDLMKLKHVDCHGGSVDLEFSIALVSRGSGTGEHLQHLISLGPWNSRWIFFDLDSASFLYPEDKALRAHCSGRILRSEDTVSPTILLYFRILEHLFSSGPSASVPSPVHSCLQAYTGVYWPKPEREQGELTKRMNI